MRDFKLPQNVVPQTTKSNGILHAAFAFWLCSCSVLINRNCSESEMSQKQYANETFDRILGCIHWIVWLKLKNCLLLQYYFQANLCRREFLLTDHFTYFCSASKQVRRMLIMTHSVFSPFSVLSLDVMAVFLVLLLSTLLLSLHSTPLRASPSCPVGCRCYSLTVECGSTGLRDIPKYIPLTIQVGSMP